MMPENFDPENFPMEGHSSLIIGRGRTGKSGFGIYLIKKTRPKKWLIVAPRVTNPLFRQYQYYEDPIESADQLADIWNDTDTAALIVIYRGKQRGRPSIWEILQAEEFRDFTIFGDELGTLNRISDEDDYFINYICAVGQNNQQFFGATHRLRDDLRPIVAQNVEKIYYVGQTYDQDEIRILYGISNRSKEFTMDQFAQKLAGLKEKFNWWSDHPDQAGSVFEIYS